MEKLTDSNKIQQYINQKYTLELELARKLLALFDDESAGIIGELRHICRQSTGLLDVVRSADPQKFDANHNADLKIYGCFKNHGITSWNMQIIASKTLRYSASDCGDFIRVFGEVFEKNSTYTGTVTGSNINKQRLEPQKGGAEHWAKSGLRDRSQGKDAAKQSFIHKQLKHDGEVHGILRWVQGDKDTCRKLDKIFGLCPGATISGTTTDNIFFFDKFSRGGMDPVMYLLPMAAIVGNGHHTTIEVALPLTLNGKMDYVVGLYSTLLPKAPRSGRREAWDTAARTIESILRNYETTNSNQLMAIYYTGKGAIEGAYIFEKSGHDIERWKGFARSSKAMMDFTKTVKPWPSSVDVGKLLYQVFQ